MDCFLFFYMSILSNSKCFHACKFDCAKIIIII